MGRVADENGTSPAPDLRGGHDLQSSDDHEVAEILPTPRNEFPEFPAALSFLPLITPDAATELLGARRDRLVQRLAERDALIAEAGVALPRVTMLETEYLHALIRAEIQWVDDVLAGLRDGSITWSRRELLEAASQLDQGR